MTRGGDIHKRTSANEFEDVRLHDTGNVSERDRHGRADMEESHAPDQDVSLENMMVAGSHTRRQLSIASSIVIDDNAPHGPDYPYHKLPCNICQAEIGFNSEGGPFVPCECAFCICRACYEYVRKFEGGRCPRCDLRYTRLKGSPAIVDDSPEDIVEHMEEVEHSGGEQGVQEPPAGGVEAGHMGQSMEEIAIITGPDGGQLPAKTYNYHGDGSDSLASTGSPSHNQIPGYGYGSIVWVGHRAPNGSLPPVSDGEDANGAESSPEEPPPVMVDDTRRPLSRKVPVSPSLLNPYRFLVVVRFIVMLAFFRFRVLNPNPHAYPLWLTSVICEIWFGISWIFDQIPKWSPITRETYLNRLSLRFEHPGEVSRLPNVDVFVSTADPQKEPPLVTANVILSVLAVDYPIDKMACYLSDDGASMLTFEALTETANFARAWVPFCKKYAIEPRAPEMYFSQKVDYLKGQVVPNFVRDRRHMKCQYDEFKVRINCLVAKSQDVPKDGWRMPDGTAWPGNQRMDHVGMIQVFLQPDGETRDVNGDPLPRLVYLSREKRLDHEHNKKAGAMNALMRASALITNAPYVLNLDCDHYINNSEAIREGICFLVDPQQGGRVAFVQFPQRFDGVDRNDRYANHNTIFYDCNMKGHDGQQGPMYVGTGCMFRRQALYGYEPPTKPTKSKPHVCCWLSWIPGWGRTASHKVAPNPRQRGSSMRGEYSEDDVESVTTNGPRQQRMSNRSQSGGLDNFEDDEKGLLLVTKAHVKRFGMCHNFIASTLDTHGGALATDDPHEVLCDVILVISCGYEDDSEWGKSCGWMYGSVTEDIVTGFLLHTQGWRSIYCMPKRPAFKGSAPINLTDRLAQVLRWTTGSVEIFFSSYNPIWGYCCTGLKPIQRIAYINTALYPFTSIFLTTYCFLPAIGLFTNQFIVINITNYHVLYFLALFCTIFATALLEIRWGGVTLEEWWRNEQFWVIGGTSAHLAAVLQGFLKLFAGVDVQFTLTTKSSDSEDDMAELYLVRWTWLFFMPCTIIIVNSFAILAGVARALGEGSALKLGQLVGQVFFSMWVLLHMYPFVKGLSGRSQKVPTIVLVWAMLLAIVLSLLWSNVDLG